MKNSLKTLAFVALFLTGGFVSQAQAQVDVMVNPIGLLFGNLGASADFMLADNLSVEGQIGIGFGDDGAFDYFNLPITAYGKYYFNPEDGADKFYASAWLRFINRNWEGNDNTFVSEYTQTRLGLGFGAGYKVVGNSGLVFDIGLGVGRAFLDNISIDNEEDIVDWPDIMFAGKLAIGYRFGR